MGEGLTQDELNRLFTTALETGLALLAKQDSFLPLLFEIRADRTIHALAVLDRASSDDPIAGLVDVFRQRAAQGVIMASAIATDGATEDERGRAICVRLRAANFASNLIASYTRDTSGLLRKHREVDLGEIAARSVANDVFGDA